MSRITTKGGHGGGARGAASFTHVAGNWSPGPMLTDSAGRIPPICNSAVTCSGGQRRLPGAGRRGGRAGRTDVDQKAEEGSVIGHRGYAREYAHGYGQRTAGIGLSPSMPGGSWAGARGRLSGGTRTTKTRADIPLRRTGCTRIRGTRAKHVAGDSVRRTAMCQGEMRREGRGGRDPDNQRSKITLPVRLLPGGQGQAKASRRGGAAPRRIPNAFAAAGSRERDA